MQNYAGKIRALAAGWLIYAAFAGLTGVVGLTFALAGIGGHFGPELHGPWGNGSMEPWLFAPALLRLAWTSILVRVALAITAGWGLLERAPWGRIVAIIAAILCILKFPFGTALAIWTLVLLLGYRNNALYDQL